jgi:hypothetical protein
MGERAALCYEQHFRMAAAARRLAQTIAPHVTGRSGAAAGGAAAGTATPTAPAAPAAPASGPIHGLETSAD